MSETVTRSVKWNDPSNLNNKVNGYDVNKCESPQQMTLFLVIPNLGYGLPCNIIARTGEPRFITPDTQFRYRLDPETEGTDGEVLDIFSDERMVPLAGTTHDMFVATVDLNSACAKDYQFDSPLKLPFPVKIRPLTESEHVELIRRLEVAGSKQLAVFDMARQISETSSGRNATEILSEALASEIMRAASATMEETAGQWTGTVDENNPESRVEYPELFDRGTYFDEIAKGATPAELGRVFLTPAALILVESGGSKRLYFSRSLTESLFTGDFSIVGNANPPTISYATALHVSGDVGSRDWLTGSADFDTLLSDANLSTWCSDIVAGNRNADVTAFLPEDLCSLLTLRRKEDDGSVTTLSTKLATFRPPAYSAGDVIHGESGFIFPFTASYLFPFGRYSDGGETTVGYMSALGILEVLEIDEDSTERYQAMKFEGFCHLAYALKKYFAALGTVMELLDVVSNEQVLSEDELGERRGGMICLAQFPFADLEDDLALESVTGLYYGNSDIYQGIRSEDLAGYSAKVPVPAQYNDDNVIWDIIETGARARGGVMSRGSDFARRFVVKTTLGTVTPGEEEPATAAKGALLAKGEAAEDGDLLRMTIPASVDNDGYVSLSEIFAQATESVPDNDHLSWALELIGRIPRLAGETISLVRDTVIQVAGGTVIDPGHPSGLSGLTVIDGMIDIIEELGRLRDFISPSAQSDEDEDVRAEFLEAMEDMRTYAGGGEARDPRYSAAVISQGLNRCLITAESVAGHIIARTTAGHAFYCQDVDNDGYGLVDIPDATGNFGFWLYNMRKTYLLWVSLMTLIIAFIERAIALVEMAGSTISVRLAVPEDEGEAEIGIYMFHDASGNPVYPKLTEEFDFDGAPNVRINQIQQVFPADTLYYEMNFSLTRVDPQEEIEPVLLPGFGFSGEFDELDIPEAYRNFWETDSEGNDEWLEELYNGLEDEFEEVNVDGNFSTLQGRLSPVDFIGRADGNYRVIQVVNETREWKDVAPGDFGTSVITPNLTTLPKIIGSQIRGKIDATYMLPYTGDIRFAGTGGGKKVTTEIFVDLTFNHAMPENVNISGTAFGSKTSTILGAYQRWFSNAGEAIDRVKYAASSIMKTLSSRGLGIPLAEGELTELIVPFIGTTDPTVNSQFADSELLVYTLRELGCTTKSGFESAMAASMEDLSWNVYNSGTLTHQRNYNLFLSKRRAYTVANLVICRMMNAYPNGIPVQGTTKHIAVTTDSVTMGSPWKGMTVRRIINAPFRALGFGTLLGNCAIYPGISVSGKEGHYRKMRKTLVAFNTRSTGGTFVPVLINDRYFNMKVPMQADDGIKISSNSPYVPDFGVEKNQLVSGTTLRYLDKYPWLILEYYQDLVTYRKLSTYVTAAPASWLNAVKKYDRFAAKKAIEDFINLFFDPSDDGIFTYTGGILTNAKIIIVDKPNT